MSNHTGKLVMGAYKKLKWWFVDVFRSEQTSYPLGPPPDASDMVTKGYVDGQMDFRQAPEDVIPGKQSMEGPGYANIHQSTVLMGKIQLDAKEIELLASKIGQKLADDLEIAKNSVKSPTKSKIDAKRASNTTKLKNQARNEQSEAQKLAMAQISCQICGFVATSWPADTLRPHISPNSYENNVGCDGLWLPNANNPDTKANTVGNGPKNEEESRKYVNLRLNGGENAPNGPKETGECPSCHWKPASEGGLPCRSCVEEQKVVSEGKNCSEYPDCDGNCCEKA